MGGPGDREETLDVAREMLWFGQPISMAALDERATGSKRSSGGKVDRKVSRSVIEVWAVDGRLVSALEDPPKDLWVARVEIESSRYRKSTPESGWGS